MWHLGIPADHGGPALCDGLGTGRSQTLQVSLESPGPQEAGVTRGADIRKQRGQMHRPFWSRSPCSVGILGVPAAPPVLLEHQAGPAKSWVEGGKELALLVTREETTRS